MLKYSLNTDPLLPVVAPSQYTVHTPVGSHKWKQTEVPMPTIIIILLLLVFLAMLLTPTKLNDETLRKTSDSSKKTDIRLIVITEDDEIEFDL